MSLITIRTPDKDITVSSPDGTLFADLLSDAGYSADYSCGRNGMCGRCKIKLISGNAAGDAPDKSGAVRACRATVLGNATVSLPAGAVSGFAASRKSAAGGADSDANVLPPPDSFRESGVAVDLGTTTICTRYYRDGTCVASAARLNPQSAFGADVMSRISTCPAALGKMQETVTEAIGQMLAEMKADASPHISVAGNTTMLHILAGIDPSALGVSPFNRGYTGTKNFSLPYGEATLLPCPSAFIGGDVVAGIVALEAAKARKPYLLADLGTNAELALVCDDEILCTSAAAGPAFEGGGIECGCGGIPGAVCKAKLTAGTLDINTVCEAPAAAICGSGLLSTVSLLLDHGLISPDGLLGATAAAPPALTSRLRKDKFFLTNRVFISQRDIRSLQLAKAAVRAASQLLLEAKAPKPNSPSRDEETVLSKLPRFLAARPSGLLEHKGVEPARLSALYVAGGLGNHASSADIFRLGLFDPALSDVLIPVGNTALGGAALCLDDKYLQKASAICDRCRTVILGGNPDFSSSFIQHMNFI